MPTFAGGRSNLVIFLLPAHISALAVSLLVFVSEQYWIIAFGVAISAASKWMLKAPMRMPNGKVVNKHFLNPSNFGISIVLLLFPTVGIAPAYMFTESTWGIGDWLVTILIYAIGGMFNFKFTGRWPLIATWFLAFAFFGVVRSWINDTSTIGRLIPMTGFAFVLFTFLYDHRSRHDTNETKQSDIFRYWRGTNL